ncbi:universal stress protein (plasmid) [Sphingomonas paeninsulae]|uniref:Universal stress protein n=2 Tax=Sphingomonas paeninsulae TaxID=2319844 RepID=A0A494TFH4_SPHPE|nr:universal stress protein [Sphingomonas paeninsulae]
MYQTIMVHLKLSHTNTGLLTVVSELADRFGSRIVGVVACQPIPIVYCEVPLPPTLMEEDTKEIRREMGLAEAEFRAAFFGKPNQIEWRSSIGLEPTSDFVAREARCADLVVTSAVSFDPSDTARRENPAQIVLQTGRPVLIVPRDAPGLKLNRMTIAWKETPEARRAVADALPLLKTASHVSIVHLAPERDRHDALAGMKDVAGWLDRHGIVAEVIFTPTTQGDDAYQLNEALENNRTDVVVAGAYGHSRLRQWVFGGVTRDLTLHAGYCALLSH